jgi:vitamin B12 transporter
MRQVLLATVAVLGGVSSALAQPTGTVTATTTTAIPDTIVTATRVPTPIERVPGAVTVITRQQIEERGYATLAEALAFAPGARLAPTGGVGQQTSGFFRGNSSRSVLVLLDGVPVNDPSDPSGAFNFGNDSLFDVERIEVLRGPTSSLYGSAAVGAVINIITRRAPRDRQFAPYGTLAGGSQATLSGGAGATGTIGAFDYLASANGLSTAGTNATARRFFNTLNERDGFSGGAGAARLGFTPQPGTRIEGLVRYRANRFGIDSVPRDDPNYTADDRRWFGQLRAETELFGGAWTTGIRGAYTQDRRAYSNLPDVLSRATANDYFRGEQAMVDWGNIVRLPNLGILGGTALSFGVNYLGQDVTSRSGNLPFQTRVNARQDSLAGNLSLQTRIGERVDFTVGLRHDAVENFTGATTWRMGAVVNVPEVNGRVYAAGGTAFNAPSLFQRFGVIGTTFRGNPNLRPEYSTGYEIGAQLDVPLLERANGITFGVTWFQSWVKDLINFNARFNSLENVDRANIQGAEILFAVRPFAWLTAEVAWTITQTQDGRTLRPLPRRPESVVSFLARVEPVRGLVITPQVLFTGRSPENAFATYLDNGRSVAVERRNKTGTIFNITASYPITPQITGFLEGRNLTNTDFEAVNGFQVPGRSVIVGTRFQF